MSLYTGGRLVNDIDEPPVHVSARSHAFPNISAGQHVDGSWATRCSAQLDEASLPADCWQDQVHTEPPANELVGTLCWCWRDQTWTKPWAARLEGGASQGLPIPPGVDQHLNHPKWVMTLTSLDRMVMTRGQPVAGAGATTGWERSAQA